MSDGQDRLGAEGDEGGAGGPTSRTTPWLAGLASGLGVGLAAACVACSPAVQQRIGADSLIYTVLSLSGWSPFLWGEDRLGQLTGLVASGVTGWVENHMLQSTLAVAGTLAVPGLFGGLFLGWRGAAGGLLASALAVLAAPPETFVHGTNGSQPGLGLALGAAGLLALARAGTTRAGRAAGTGLLALGIWVYEAVAAPAVLLVLAGLPTERRPADAPRAWTDVARDLALVLGCWASLRLVAGQLGTPSTLRSVLPPQGWGESVARLATAAGADLVGPRLPWLVLALGALAGAAARRDPPGWRGPGRGALVLGFAGLATFVVLGVSGHVAASRHHPRYGALPVTLGWAALGLVIAGYRVGPRCPGTRTIGAGLALGLAGALTYGLPSPARVRGVLDSRWGAVTGEVLAHGVTRLTGDYWTVWPIVVLANDRLVRAGRPPVVRGWTGRSQADRRERDRVEPARDRLGVLLTGQGPEWIPPSSLAAQRARRPAAESEGLRVYAFDPWLGRFPELLDTWTRAACRNDRTLAIRLRAGRDPAGVVLEGPLAPLPPGPWELVLAVGAGPASAPTAPVLQVGTDRGPLRGVAPAELARTAGSLRLPLPVDADAAAPPQLRVVWPGAVDLDLEARLEPRGGWPVAPAPVGPPAVEVVLRRADRFFRHLPGVSLYEALRVADPVAGSSGVQAFLYALDEPGALVPVEEELARGGAPDLLVELVLPSAGGADGASAHELPRTGPAIRLGPAEVAAWARGGGPVGAFLVGRLRAEGALRPGGTGPGAGR